MPENRNHNLQIRVNLAEKEAWARKAKESGVTVSQLVRLALARTQTWTLADQQIVREYKYELNTQLTRIGNNLNQIARWVNTYKDEADTLQVLKALYLIEEKLKDIVEKPLPLPSDLVIDEEE